MSAMTAEVMTVPMAMHRKMVPVPVVMPGMVAVVMAIMVPAVMIEMSKAMPKKTMAEKPMTMAAMPAAAMGNGVALRDSDEQEKRRDGCKRSCRSHRVRSAAPSPSHYLPSRRHFRLPGASKQRA